jgi:aminoglycoside phosphotransferase (APT) family kinase protein
VRTEEECRAALRAAFPGLEIEALGYLAQGWDSTVFAVNGTYVFRFPKRAGVDATLQKEIRLLPALLPVLPVPIPEFAFVSGPSASYAWHVVGYRTLPGMPADEREWRPDGIRAVAPVLAAFLRALHTFPRGRAIELGAPSYTPKAWLDRHAALYRRARDVGQPLVPAGVFRRFVTDWERMLADGALIDFESTLIHGDLAMEHVLVDDDGRLSGVIDFGDAMVADPALDFAGFPEELAQAVLDLYTDDPSVRHGIWARRVLYLRAGPLHAITAGDELGRGDLIRSGIDALRRTYG